MKILISGATGFLGRPLAASLTTAGHDVVALSRGGPQPRDPLAARIVAWSPDGGIGPWAGEVDGAGAVINLAGESIGAGRWTEERKALLLDSRVRATRSLAAAIARAASPPPIFISGSAVGYYGPCGDEIVTEDAPAGHDFLADICVQWEAEARRAESPNTRVVVIRTGLVLERDGGALPRMLPPFWFGVGGRIGSGRQYWPWIRRQDWIELVRFAIDHDRISGPINATAPEPVPNAAFSNALGRAMRRPAFMPAPAFALKLLLGEMADGLLLSGQRAVPAKAERGGFVFRYRTIDAALGDLFGQ